MFKDDFESTRNMMLDLNYNIEYYDGKHNVQTFNADLFDMDAKYLYFKNTIDNRIAIIDSTCIRTMISSPKKDKVCLRENNNAR